MLVDHFDFLDRSSKGPKSKQKASKQQAAMDAEWLLSTDDKWVQKYFDSSDLHSVGSATLSLIFFASRSLDSPLDAHVSTRASDTQVNPYPAAAK